MPSCNSIWCFAKVAACAELPRAQVTANCGGRDLSRATSAPSGAAKACCCRRTASGASRNSSAIPMSRLHAGIGFGADRLRQSQRARQRIALRRDAVLPAADARPTDAARADDDNAAVLSRMGADTGGLRVADDQGMAEREMPRARGGQFSRLGGAGEREAGAGPCQGRLAQPGLGEALPGGIDHRCKGRVQPKAEIGRSGGPLAENMPGPVDEPRAAARTAAIDAEKQIGPE